MWKQGSVWHFKIQRIGGGIDQERREQGKACFCVCVCVKQGISKALTVFNMSGQETGEAPFRQGSGSLKSSYTVKDKENKANGSNGSILYRNPVWYPARQQTHTPGYVIALGCMVLQLSLLHFPANILQLESSALQKHHVFRILRVYKRLLYVYNDL